MSQQEDDLRSLAKIMDMLRGVAMILVVANIYWFCQSLIGGWHPPIEEEQRDTNRQDNPDLAPLDFLILDTLRAEARKGKKK